MARREGGQAIVSYYENRIKALEARIEEMAMLNRMKAVRVEAGLMIRIKELNDENARLKSEVERLKLDYYENKTGEVSATVIQTFNTETGETDYVVSLDDYKKMAGMFSAEFSRLTAEVKRLTLLQAETLSERNKAEAEIERLNKAGDAIYQSFDQFGQVDAMTLKKWQTAKDGKDAR